VASTSHHDKAADANWQVIGKRSRPRMSQRNGNTGIGVLADRKSARMERLWLYPHQLLDPFDLGGFEKNPALPARPALEILDGHLLATNHEQGVVGLTKPVVLRRCRDSQATSGLLGR
jgi:hypothetical protein